MLLDKLRKYGVNDLENAWFTNYLSDRIQVVCVGNGTSEPCQVLSGVPQGSILGPLLFVIFVNDLPYVTSKCSVLMYADDTVIFYASKEVSEIGRVLNSELSDLYEWLLNNKLFLKVKKTECLLLGTAPRLSKIDNFTIIVGNSVVRRVTEFKY